MKKLILAFAFLTYISGQGLFGGENNAALEKENQKILLQIQDLQAEFENEDSLKKRSQIQNQIDTLKKQYAENALLLQNPNASKSNPSQSQAGTSNASNPAKASNQPTAQKQTTQTTQRKPKTFKQKQTGSFIALGGGGFLQSTELSFSPTPTISYDKGANINGGVFLAKAGYQSMWADWIGGRGYISGGYLGGGFVSVNVDLLLQIPVGGVAFGVYGGVGVGMLWSDVTYKANYLTKVYSFTPKRIGAFNAPFGIAIAFGHSRIEWGGLVITGGLEGTQYDIKTTYKTSLVATTLSYQFTF